jgi:hypothetical protein
MKGVAGYPGWFWLFVIMGGFTIASGMLMGVCLPDSVERPTSLFLPGVSFFTEREIHILRSRVKLDDPRKSTRKQHIGLEAFRKAVSENSVREFSDLAEIFHIIDMATRTHHVLQQRPIPRLRHVWPNNHQEFWLCVLDKQRHGICRIISASASLLLAQLRLRSFVSARKEVRA